MRLSYHLHRDYAEPRPPPCRIPRKTFGTDRVMGGGAWDALGIEERHDVCAFRRVRAIDREDERESLTSLVAVNRWRMSREDRCGDFRKLQAVALGADAQWIRCPCRCDITPDLKHSRFLFTRTVSELPRDDLPFLKNDCSAIAIQLNSSRKTGIRACCSLNCAQSATLKLKNGDPYILYLDLKVRPSSCESMHFRHISTYPEQQVNPMYRLIHQRAPTIEGPSRTPGTGGIIRISPIPGHVGGGEYRFRTTTQSGDVVLDGGRFALR